ncbi:hypothetical protein ON010_g1895 [Phytophthora cinnamomi]|nr:hypothetical protein ON010_g1895 [Phytophthora cinnamomi]
MFYAQVPSEIFSALHKWPSGLRGNLRKPLSLVARAAFDAKWLSKTAPNFNPIKNVWGQLAWSVYEGGRRFDTKDELKAQVGRSWKTIKQNYLQHFANGMSTRMVQVVLKNVDLNTPENVDFGRLTAIGMAD